MPTNADGLQNLKTASATSGRKLDGVLEFPGRTDLNLPKQYLERLNRKNSTSTEEVSKNSRARLHLQLRNVPLPILAFPLCEVNDQGQFGRISSLGSLIFSETLLGGLGPLSEIPCHPKVSPQSRS